MDPTSYTAFGEALIASLRSTPGVLGLVAVGSFAGGADAWSDQPRDTHEPTPERNRPVRTVKSLG